MATLTSGARRVFTSSISSPGLLRSLRSSKASANLERLSRPKLLSTVSRIPVELGCVQSLMPLHSVTASALLNSMLSLKSGSWGWLSEGLATPL